MVAEKLGAAMRLVYIATACSVLMLTGCATKGAFDHYDKCLADDSQSFETMIACGKKARNEYCKSYNDCSGDGNAAVAYGDSLVASVKNHEMTESEAKRKWIDYRNNRTDANNNDANGAALAAAVNRPRSCTRYGQYLSCF